MGSAKETVTRKPASWADYPEYERFWSAYNDIFWGEGGNTSYHEMLLEDEAWLRDVYLQNNANMTQLEQDYIKRASGVTSKYEKSMEEGTISVGLGSGPRTSFVPQATQRSLAARRENQMELARTQFGMGQEQAGRIREYGERFTPNAAEMGYLKALQTEGEKGQQLRAGMPSATAKGDYDTGLIPDVAEVVKTGASAYDFLKRNPEILEGIGKGVKGAASLWGTGSDFFNSIFDSSSGWSMDTSGWLSPGGADTSGWSMDTSGWFSPGGTKWEF